MPKAIITGASKGIGKELAKILSQNGYDLGLMARSEDLLIDLKSKLSTKIFIQAGDITDLTWTKQAIHKLIEQLNGLDLIIANAGIGFLDKKTPWQLENELKTIEVNVQGFVVTCDTAMRYFMEKKSGHIVGISSIAGLKGYRVGPCYHASKAFVSIYMDSLRHLAQHHHLPIPVTDIRPGYVDTELFKTTPAFWVASAQKAAHQIWQAMKKKKRKAYITKRWNLIAFLLKAVPQRLFEKY